MIILYIICIIAVAALLYLLAIRGSGRRVPDELRVDYAHRGLFGDGIPENSLAAFDAAASAGFGIEFDIQLSRDGEVMVFHDYSLERMTGHTSKLCELTLSELKGLSLGQNERIPTLDEVLALVDGRVPLLIELKGESADSSLCQKAVEKLDKYSGAYCVESFNPLLLNKFKKLRPQVTRGLLYTKFSRSKKTWALDFLLTSLIFNFMASPDFIAYDIAHPDTFALRLCRALFHPALFVWTVRSRAEYDKVKSVGGSPIFEGFVPNYGD